MMFQALILTPQNRVEKCRAAGGKAGQVENGEDRQARTADVGSAANHLSLRGGLGIAGAVARAYRDSGNWQHAALTGCRSATQNRIG